jgi:opacity protein-like surface antigen
MATDEGFYISLGAGAVFVNDADVKAHDNPAYSSPFDGETGGEWGGAVHGAVGYGFANGLRVEGELGYRKTDIKELTVKEPGSLAALLPAGSPPEAVAALRGKQAVDGDVSAFTLMANLYYDIDAGGGWKPYVGGGVGLSRLSISSQSRSTGVTLADAEDTVFAYKIGGGIGYDIDVSDENLGERPVTVSLDYRYFGTEDPTFRGSVTGTKFDTEQDGHYIGASLRFNF